MEGSIHTQLNNATAKARNAERISVNSRFLYMDNLRALAMILGIFFHAALAYSPLMKALWPAADPIHSPLYDVFSWFSHLFRMPLFFLIAGFFAVLLIDKYGIAGFLKNRLIRLGLPLLLFLPLSFAAMFFIVNWATGYLTTWPPGLQTLVSKSNQPTSLSTGHLWFLFNLLWFCGLFTLLNKPRWLSKISHSPKLNMNNIVLFFPLLMVPALFSQLAPHPPADKLIPELWSLGFYGWFFLLGSVFYKRPQLIDDISKRVWPLGLFCILAFPWFYLQIPKEVSAEYIEMIKILGVEPSLGHFAIAVVEAYLAVYLTLLCLVIGKKWMDHSNAFLRYLSDASYWIYIAHVPVLFAVQFYLLEFNWPISVKFIAGTLMTLFVCTLSYALLVRHTPIGWLLNGKKRALKKSV